MGRVFTPEQVAAGQIPEPSAHEQAGRFAFESLFDVRRRGDFFEVSNQAGIDAGVYTAEDYLCIQGGMIYGSTVMGTANVRSDLDVLVVYDEYYSDIALPGIRRVFTEVENRFKVSVEGNILTQGSIENPQEHSLDFLLVKHLLEVQEIVEPQWSRGWPVLPLASYAEESGNDPLRVRALAIRYCGVKARHMAQATTKFRGEIDYLAFQRALEMPTAIARKVLAVTDGSEAVYLDLLKDRPEMLERLYKKFTETRTSLGLEKAWDKLASLVEKDKQYSDLLDSVISGNTSLEDYRQWLNDQYLILLRLGHYVALSWAEIMHRNLDKPAPPAVDEVDEGWDLSNLEMY